AYRRLVRLASAPDLDALTRRRLGRLQLAYRSKQAPVDVLDRITSGEAEMQKTYSTFRAQFDGHSATDNELEEVLRTSTDSARVRAAWEARKQIGLIVADDLCQIAQLRNEAARAVGFPDYWHAQLLLDELDPDRLIDTLEQVEAATREPFVAMKTELDRQLAERFGIAAGELRPWHYGDPFFQETPEVFAPPADPLYAAQDVVGLAAETYRQLGFGNIDAILARSDLYPRPGKNQHAYAVDIDRAGDVRTFLNVEPNARWMGTLLHELGHTIYQDGIDRTELPYDLRDDPQGFLNEGFAMFCEQPATNPHWLSGLVGLPETKAHDLAPRLAAQDKASLLAFVRWCLTIVHFERGFYAHPDQDLNGLWWDLEERYQLIPRPTGRTAPDWATKVHVATAPVYYQKYLLGRLFSAQLTHKLNADLGGWWTGRPKSGDYIKRELFMPGARYTWPELVERVTGQPLGVDALATSVAWPRAA
ncbi:MAG: M2 family metallopeptidase, partial [Chloroflexi bacterium]|nr:M2 family metallopeptidase [Chloroflexota bacterium]